MKESLVEGKNPRKSNFDPTGLNKIAVGFHEQIAGQPELLEAIPSKYRKPYLAYIRSVKTLKEIGSQNGVATITARTRILSAISSLHGSLPEEIRLQFDLETVQELRKRVKKIKPKDGKRKSGTGKDQKTAGGNRGGWGSNDHLFRGSSSVNTKNNKPKPNPETEKSETTSTRNSIYAASFEGGFGITELSQEESDRILKERKEEEERKQKRLKEHLESARDMDENEREKDPDTGAIFNITLGSIKIPNDLSQYFKDHPDLEVKNDRWQGIHTSMSGSSYITYCNGDFCYVKNDTRTPLSPDSIKRKYDWEDITSDREAIIRFGTILFVRILDDIVKTAEKAGFKPAISIS